MFPASERFPFLLMFLCLCTACDPDGAPREFIDRAPEVTTTSGEIAVLNLHSNIDGLRRALARTGSFDVASRLTDLLLTRARYLGSYSDFAEAQQLAEQLVQGNQRADALVLRARVRGALHDFAGAEDDLNEAHALSARDVSGAQATIALATGRDLDEVLVTRTQALEKGRSFQTLSDTAAIYAALGRFEEADAHFVEALERYRDVSPFPVAWVHFQRGVMWAEQAARPDIARPLYERAVGALPNYVVANVHLAELESLDGDIDRAVARLERIYVSTEDPEPAGLLAELLTGRDPDRADALTEDARQTYDELLKRYPLAFLDHASEFFAGPGDDPSRAVQLALENLDHRENHRAYIVAIEAALADRRSTRACELAEAAGTLAGHNVNLTSLAATVLTGC